MFKSSRIALALAAFALPVSAQAGVIDTVGGLTLHLTASDLAQANGSAVTNWGSLSQSVAGSKPTYITHAINGLPAIRFDGNDFLSQSADVSAQSIYIVVNHFTDNVLDGVISNGNDSQNIRLDSTTHYRSAGNNSDGNDFANGGTLFVNGVPSGAYALNTPHLVAAVSNTLQTYDNFVVGGPKPSDSGFNSRFLVGDVAEIAVFNSILSTKDNHLVSNTLARKYGLPVSKGYVIPGLIGHDLTDPEDNGNPEANVGYNATFSSNNEPGFGGGEFAFNVFDNQVGSAGGNNKWCCDAVATNNSDGANFHWVAASFSNSHTLDTFTLTSSNDSPDRDPRVFSVQGSNDGVNWIDIFVQNDPNTDLWTDRNQTLEFDVNADFAPAGLFRDYRLAVFGTGDSATGGGANFALAEIELFGTVPSPATLPSMLLLVGGFVLRRRR